MEMYQRVGGELKLVPLGEAAEAMTAAEAAQGDAAKAKADADAAKTDAATAKADADAAKTDAATAKAQAADAKTVAKNSLEIAVGARADAAQALVESEAAQGDAATAKTQAADAKAQAQSAQSAAQAAQAKATEARTAADGKLPLAGGTLTGNLKVSADLWMPITTCNPNLDMTAELARDYYTGIHGLDKNNNRVFQVGANITPSLCLSYFNVSDYYTGKNRQTELGLICTKSGVRYAYLNCTPRENLYQNDIDTLQASINRHPLKLTGNLTIHVGGGNASDTADLFKGRGMSADKPFATLDAAIKFAMNNYTGPYDMVMMLHADMTLPNNYTFRLSGVRRYVIMSDATRRKLTMKDCVARDGCLYFQDIHLAAAAGSQWLVHVSGWSYAGVSAKIGFAGATEMSGAVSMANMVTNMGGVIVCDSTSSFTGTVNGPRYKCSFGGKIYLGGKSKASIPGTVEGTEDTGGGCC